VISTKRHGIVHALAYRSLQQSRRERKKIETRFAHMKRIFKLDRLRLRGLSGAKDEVLLTATAQNLKRLVKFLCRAPPSPIACPA
jgi:IS5 family transposase